MSAKRKPSKARRSASSLKSAARPARKSLIRVRQVRGGEAWELVHPPCASERADDLAEVRQMIDAGETDIAKDELLWLLEGCRDLISAHRLLAEIALQEGNMTLSRAHFGYAYQLGIDALPTSGFQGHLLYRLPPNHDFLESAKGLAGCLRQLGKHQKARDVLKNLLALDPSDPLGAAAMLCSL